MAKRKRGWLTPESLAGDEICRPLFLPANDEVLSLAGGALSELTKAYNYEQSGSTTPEEVSEFFSEALARWYNEQCGEAGGIPTPFWDDVTKTDDEAPSETQTWYGTVDDPDLPADELTFIEQAGIWAFTGLLALTGTPAAAILFNTLAPSFVLAMRGDDFAEVIRIIVDGHEQATIETTGDPDEIFRVPVVGDPGLSSHDILIILKDIP